MQARLQPQIITYLYVRQTTQLHIGRSLDWAFNAAAFYFCHELRESSNSHELDASILGDVCGGGAGPWCRLDKYTHEYVCTYNTYAQWTGSRWGDACGGALFLSRTQRVLPTLTNSISLLGCDACSGAGPWCRRHVRTSMFAHIHIQHIYRGKGF